MNIPYGLQNSTDKTYSCFILCFNSSSCLGLMIDSRLIKRKDRLFDKFNIKVCIWFHTE